MSNEFLPYGRQSISDDDIEAVVEVLRGEWLTTGPAVERFERDLERVTGVPTVAVSSGTAALHVAYEALGVEPGVDVITTPLTFIATAATAMRLGARVIFADIRDDTLNLDPDTVEPLLTNRTAVIAPIDYAGRPADIPAFLKIADRTGALVLEDAAHAIGSKLGNSPVGSMAHLTTFSFHPVKTVTTAEGGAIAVADSRFLEVTKRMRNHGLIRDSSHFRLTHEGGWHQEVHRLGLNYRLPDVLAALGSSQLGRLRRLVERRKQLVDRYHELLRSVDGLRLPAVAGDSEDVAWHLFVVRIRGGRRRWVYEYMRSRGIGVQVHYLPAHLHPVFADLGYKRGACPVAEKAYDELLSLPLYPALTEAQQDRVADELCVALR